MPDLTTTAGPELAAEFLEEARRGATFPVPQDGLFVYPDGGESDYLHAPDLETIARRLMARYPEAFGHLAELETAFLWKRRGGASNGNLTLGKCQKASGLLRYLTESVYVIWLAADHCRDGGLTYHQVDAALYHEMLHAGLEGIVGHDVEMFGAEVTRFGLWREPLKIAKRAFEQLPLFGETERGER